MGLGKPTSKITSRYSVRTSGLEGLDMSFKLILLCLIYSLPYAVYGAQPLVPACSQSADTCTVVLEASYQYTMTFNDQGPLGNQWVPVEAVPEGLRTKGGPGSCGRNKRLLTPEEAATVIIGDGLYRLVYTINGTLPGPTLVVYEGQQVVVEFHNNMQNEVATLHFHGMHQRGTPFMDGAGQVSQCPIAPGETFTYRFKAEPSGTFWYHSHFGSTFTMGLQGAFIVLPASTQEEQALRGEDPLPEFESEYVLVVTDLMAGFTPEINLLLSHSAESYGFGFNSDYCFTENSQADGSVVAEWSYFSGLINGRGRHYLTPGSFRAINPYVPLEVFPVDHWKKYYFRTICSSFAYAFAISIDGHPLHVTSSDGHPLVTQTVDQLIISSGERYDFWIDASDPDGIGKYWIRAETLELFTGNGQPMHPHLVLAILQYSNTASGDPNSNSKNCTQSNICTALNCPYQSLASSYNTSCINLDELRLPVADTSAWEDEEDVMEFFLDMQTGPLPGKGIHPTINAIRNTLPPYPLQVYPNAADTLRIVCEEDYCEAGCACAHIIKIPLGSLVHLVIFSAPEVKSPKVMPHPIHIHGYSPQVVKVGWPTYDPVNQQLQRGTDAIHCLGGSLCNAGAEWVNASWAMGNLPDMIGPTAPKKDTVNLPSGGYIVLRFRADNPGFWLMHCHVESHLVDGMSFVVQVGEPEDMPSAPARMARCGNFALSEEEYYNAIDRITYI